jgi:hypothetical protein
VSDEDFDDAITEEISGPEAEGRGVSIDDFVAYMPMHAYIFTPCRELWAGASVNARLPRLADVLDTLGNPGAVTLGQLIEQAVGRDAADWLLDRTNRRAIPHRMERCGYVPVRNPDADDGLWKVEGKRQTVYAKANLTPREQMAAARRGGT